MKVGGRKRKGKVIEGGRGREKGDGGKEREVRREREWRKEVRAGEGEVWERGRRRGKEAREKFNAKLKFVPQVG